MRLIPEQTSLVIVGVWNPAILQPPWFAHHVVGLAVGVEFPAQIEFGALQEPRTIVVNGIRYVPSRNRLTFQIVEPGPQNFAQVQHAAARILRLLPHTPIHGLGRNFVCVQDDPQPDDLAVFNDANDLATKLDFPFDLQGSQIIQSIVLNDKVLNLTRVREGNSLRIAFNFHADVKQANDAAALLERPDLLMSDFEDVRRFIRSMYGIDLPDAINNGDVAEAI